MFDFYTLLNIFYTLLGVSVLAAGILLVSYQRERQNLLLRSSCILIMLMYAAIVAGHFYPDDVIQLKQGPFCDLQALFLNYCYICIHAHAALMMWNNCYVALGWSWRVFNRYLDRELTMVILSYALPLLLMGLPTWYLSLNDTLYSSVSIHPGPFYCNLVRPRFLYSTFAYMIFSAPGTLLSVLLLYKTWIARQRTLTYGNTTQLTLTYMFRLSFSTFVYLCLAFGSFVPLFILNEPADPYPIRIPPSNLRSPWQNPTLCSKVPESPELAYFARLFCPTPMSYFPVTIGISLFLMYGFGTYARTAYKAFAERYLCFSSVKRRNSTLPLMTESDEITVQGAERRLFAVEEDNDVDRHQSTSEQVPSPSSPSNGKASNDYTAK